MEHYRQIAIFAWQAGASFGNKIEPLSKRELRGEGIPRAVPGIDDEAASDPEDQVSGLEVADIGGQDVVAMIPPLTPLTADVQLQSTVPAPVTPEISPPLRRASSSQCSC